LLWGTRRPFAQSHGLQRLPALNGLGNGGPGACHEARLILGIPNIAFRPELCGL
jgi:hypothetical protein